MPLGGEAALFTPVAVRSLLDQTLEDWELIIQPNLVATPDRVLPDDLIQRDRIRCLEPANNNIPQARNACLDAAEGDFIAVLDADDLARPDRLERQVAYMQSRPDVDLIAQPGASARVIDHNGDLIREFQPDVHFTFDNADEKVQMHHSSTMFRNDGYRYREKFHRGEDFDLYFRIADATYSNVDVVTQDWLTARYYPSSSSRNLMHYSWEFSVVARVLRRQRDLKGEDGYEGWDPKNNSRIVDEVT